VKNDRPDWVQANPKAIAESLARMQAQPSGGWYVASSSRRVCQGKPISRTIAGVPFVFWRHGADVYAAPEACPHMGAPLACASQSGPNLVCPWHGLELGPSGHGSWKPLPSYDDGVLVWVRLPSDAPTDRPFECKRPEHGVSAVIERQARCEPSDVIANRLDPWHGSHFHPYAFRDLEVLEVTDDAIEIDVTYRVVGKYGVRVGARFECPDPRTIVMTIVRGEGEGSVVETHATPVSAQCTAIIEATIATSNRDEFVYARRASALLRPALAWRAKRLWVDDAAYAERRYAIRSGEVPGAPRLDVFRHHDSVDAPTPRNGME